MKPLLTDKPLSAEARTGAVIVVVALLALLALLFSVFAWTADIRMRASDQMAARDLLVERTKQAAAGGAARLTAEDGVERMFLTGDTEGLAIANFQSLVHDVAAQSGMSVQRIQPMEASSEASPDAYRLGVEATGSLEQLRSFLTSLEAALPVIFVRDVEIKPAGAQAGGEDPFPSENLAVSLRLEAHGRRSAP